MSAAGTLTIVNRKEHPRILILDDDGAGIAERLDNVVLPGTIKVISSLQEVDQSEWDAVFLSDEYTLSFFSSAGGKNYRRTIADHLFVFFLLPDESYDQYGTLDYVKGHNKHSDPKALTLQWEIPGHEIGVKPGLDRELRESLVNDVEGRDTQSGLVDPGELPEGVTLDAFAVGPQSRILAGSLKVVGRGDVWFVPNAVANLAVWVTAAFSSWRRIDSKKFPGVPDWWAAPEWYSAAESHIALKIKEETAEFEKAKAKFVDARAELQRELGSATHDATGGSRQLLRGQDDALQEAVGAALVDLGFQVRDMDLEWDDKERREDFRITDSEDTKWHVIGDATGVRGNAKGNKIAALQGYVTKYVFEDKPASIPGMWYLLNREIDKDPNARSTILRADEIDPFAAQQGLILDTTALYVLVRHAHQHPDSKSSIRKYLRTAVGLFGLADARMWVAAQA